MATKNIIYLSGPQGNVFYIFAQVKKACEANGIDWEATQSRLKSGDYDNVLSIVRQEFKDFITLKF